MADFRAIAIHVDVTQEDSVQKMVDAVVKEFGRIDYSVNSAGASYVHVTDSATLLTTLRRWEIFPVPLSRI